MLNYVITIAISAFFVPHYLSIFWEPLRTNPWDVDRRHRRDRGPRPAQHRRDQGGGQPEHRPRRRRLRDAAPARRCSASSLDLQPAHAARRTSTGASRRRGATFAARDPGRDDRLHRDRDRLEPRRGGARPAARSSRARSRWVAIAVFAIYFTLPLDRALGAAGAHERRRLRDAARPRPAGGGYKNDPCSASSRTSACTGSSSTARRSTSASSPRRSSSSRRTPA